MLLNFLHSFTRCESVEQDSLVVLVIHTFYVPEDVLFSDDSEQSAVVSDQGLTEAKFAKHIDDSL